MTTPECWLQRLRKRFRPEHLIALGQAGLIWVLMECCGLAPFLLERREAALPLDGFLFMVSVLG